MKWRLLLGDHLGSRGFPGRSSPSPAEALSETPQNPRNQAIGKSQVQVVQKVARLVRLRPPEVLWTSSSSSWSRGRYRLWGDLPG